MAKETMKNIKEETTMAQLNKAVTISKTKPTDIRNTEFFRRYGILIMVVIAFILWSALVWVVSARYATTVTTIRLTQRYDIAYEEKMQAFVEEVVAVNTPSEDEQLQALIKSEADSIAKAIGPMKTKRMKLSMLWNILMRVDSPYYPNTVEEVVSQPSQWMFYDEKNPIRDDDVELSIEQLKLWHEGRYPAGLSSTFVYGQWTENDYILRDSWDQNWKTNYWRFPE